MQKATLSELTHLANDGITEAEVHIQLTQCSQRLTKTGKPYLEVQIADSTGQVVFKIWQDKPWYDAFLSEQSKAALCVEGEWLKGDFGMEANNLRVRRLTQEEMTELFTAAGASTRQQQDWEEIERFCAGLTDPRLKGICCLFLKKFGPRLRRAAAARNFHHARRGGLVEHISGMMRSANALCPVYPELNRDLLMTGVLFHDAGKLWETCYSETDFDLPYSEAGELLGHIPLGIELVNVLWKEVLSSSEAASWLTLTPSNADVRLHVLHLIASHHGEIQFGSPVFPKTPEAMALHYIDNMDAKMEMFRTTYEKSEKLSDTVYRRNPPLPANIVTPLPPLFS